MRSGSIGFCSNQRVKTEDLYQGLYQIGQGVVERESPEYLVVAVDPVNFEKPYAEAIEGVSVVHKATPPGLDGKARLAHGYPAITATVVNTKVPVTTYANWFSYQTADFISQNKEIEQAFETTHRLYPQYKVRFVGDSGLDDQKMFVQVQTLKQEFVFRVSHLERIVEVYNERLDRWETEALKDLVGSRSASSHLPSIIHPCWANSPGYGSIRLVQDTNSWYYSSPVDIGRR